MSAYDDKIFRRLQEARIEGEPVTLSEIKQLGGLYWEDCWRRVRKTHAVGEKPNEQGEPCFELAVEPVVEGDHGGVESGRAETPTVALSIAPTLFQLPSVSAIDPMLDEAAA